MNTFCEHHKNSIKFAYRCFDRVLLNGLIQPFQQPERVIERVYAPLAAGLLQPYRADSKLQDHKRTQLIGSIKRL